MNKTITDETRVDEILTRGVHEIFTKDELKKQLMSGQVLHLKLGIDVTGPLIHLGHTVIQRKLRDFQELGHQVTLIIGDFTTLVGDHSDKVDMRSETTQDEINENAKTFQEQFFKTVIKEQTTVRHNSEWLSKLNFNDIIGLAKQFTVAQMLDRESFRTRFEQNKPIGVDEFLYPFMQGYDSVVLNCDIELGGTDQTFNLLAGRKIMENTGKKPQVAMVMKLLTGSDGRPMGKSLKNFIPVMDSPNDMYGKLMSIIDEIIWEYFELITRVPEAQIQQMRREVEDGANPMKYKKILSHNVTEFYYGTDAADKAAKNFESVVQNKQINEQEMIWINYFEVENSSIFEILKKALPDKSSGEIKRTVEQGGVQIDDKKIIDIGHIPGHDYFVIKFGKRQFIKVRPFYEK